MVVLGDRLFIGGAFTAVGGTPRNRLAAVDLSFLGRPTVWGPNVNGEVFSLALGGSVLYAGGQFEQVNGVTRGNVAAIDITTGIPTAWEARPSYPVYAIALSDTTLYMGGTFTAIGDAPRLSLGAVSTHTGTPTSWSPNPNAFVKCIAPSNRGVFVGGEFVSVYGAPRRNIAALDRTTGVVLPLDLKPNAPVRALVHSTDHLYIGGSFGVIGGKDLMGLARLDLTERELTDWNARAFNGGISNPPNILALSLANGLLYIGGQFDHAGGFVRRNIAAIDTASGSATPWDPRASGPVRALLATGNTVYAGGDFIYMGVNIPGVHRLTALDATTGIPRTFPRVNDTVLALSMIEGTVYAAGAFTVANGTERRYVMAIDSATGEVKNNWTPAPNGSVRSMIAWNNNLFIAGSFTAVGNASRGHAAMIDATTGGVGAWNPNAEKPVNALSLASTMNWLYMGGEFNSIAGDVRPSLAGVGVTYIDPSMVTTTAGPISTTLIALPNPTSSRLHLHLNLRQSSPVRIDIYNCLGEPVRRMREEMRNAGAHAIDLSLGELPAGSYFIQVISKGEVAAARFVIAR